MCSWNLLAVEAVKMCTPFVHATEREKNPIEIKINLMEFGNETTLLANALA